MRLLQRLMACVLTVCMVLPMLAFTSKAASTAVKGDPITGFTITNEDGTTEKVDESWADKYPYGIFALGNSQLSVTEGGEQQVLSVYRMGGTTDKASAVIYYQPAVVKNEDGSFGYSSAISADDITIMVEKPLPITEYQPWGTPPNPEETEIKVKSSDGVDGEGKPCPILSLDVGAGSASTEATGSAIDGSAAGSASTEATGSATDGSTAGSTGATSGIGAEGSTSGSVIGSASTEATGSATGGSTAGGTGGSTESPESYQWYVFRDGDWEKVNFAEGPELPVSQEDLNTYDFRCVFTLGGTSYCTDSYKGVPYEKPEAEVVPEAQAGIELNPAPEYEELVLNENNNKYNGVVFEVCFANGEYKKDILISTKDDSEAELDKYATLTISGCVGGEVHPSLNTLMLSVVDNDSDKAEPSQVSFSAEKVSFDKSEGKAVLTVRRTGGLTKAISVDWSLEDGLAKAGIDFVSNSGTLYFYGEQDQQTIEIELINDRTENTDEKDFTVRLSNLLGDDNSIISLDTCTVGLYNTNTAVDLNLVSTLYDIEAVDVSSAITETKGAPVSTGAITGSQVTASEGLDILSGGGKSYVDWGSGSGGLDPLIYKFGQVYFNGGNWGETTSINMSISSTGDDDNTATIWKDNNMSKLYSSLYATVGGGAAFASTWNRIWYGDEEYAFTYFNRGYYENVNIGGITVPYYRVLNSWDCSPNFWKSGAYVYLNASNPFIAKASWYYGDSGTALMLGVRKFDSKGSENKINASANVNFTRRTFNNDFSLDIYTANDEDITNVNVAKYNTDNYDAITPYVAITNGGKKNGKLYEGSTVSVKVTNSHLKPVAATIIDSSGTVKFTGSVSGDSAIFSSIILPPDGTYTFRLVLDRKQKIKIDVTTSTQLDSSGNPVGGAEAANNAAYGLLKSKNTNGEKITVGYTDKSNSLFNKTDVSEKNISLTDVDGIFTPSDGIFTSKIVENIQYINFNLSEKDVILFNGKAYGGNETIWLETKHLTPQDLTFNFYEEDYLTAERPMKAAIDATALYFDTSGDGIINGYFDEYSGVFVLVEDTKNNEFDTFVTYLDDIDYEETTFRPVVDANGTVHQYFMRPYYTANPVCLEVPKFHDMDERMQIMPNFITDVTDSSTYESLTAEQKQYRTIVSGKSSIKREATGVIEDIGYTADNRLKYTAAASAYSYVDIPLGGDKSPARAATYSDIGAVIENGVYTNPETNVTYTMLNGLAYYYSATGPGNLGNAVYTWKPNYKGNLLYKFDIPQPIYIANSLAGNRIPITTDLTTWYQLADGTWTDIAPPGVTGVIYAKNDMGAYVTENRAGAGGQDALNNYLGSFGDNDTFALVINEQVKKTDEILAGLGVLADTNPVKETITRGTAGSFPDSSYLKQNGGGKNDAAGDSSGKGEMEEFSSDVDSELFSFSSEALSLFSIETDGYEVSFSIGIPVYGEDDGGGTGSAANTLDDTKETAGKIRDFINAIKNPASGQTKKDAFSKLAGEDLDANNLKSKSVEFTVTVSLAITLKYNPLDNTYKFSEGVIVVGCEIELRLQYRFTPVPIVYVYAQFGAGISLGVGLGQNRLPEFGDTIIPQGNLKEVKLYESPGKDQSRQYYFSTDQKAFNITFSGKLYMECYEFTDSDVDGIYDKGELLGQSLDGFSAGYISSDGKQETEIVLKGQDKFELDKPVVVVLTVMDDGKDTNAEAKITSLKLVKGVIQDFYFGGFPLEIEGSIELGAGVGIEILKAEIFAKVSLGVAFTYASYEGDGKYGIASIDDFSLAGGVGFRVVLLFFNYEMDLIEYHLNYDGTSWTHGWSALGGSFGGDREIGPKGVEGDGKIHVYITPPSQVKARVYDNNVTYQDGDVDDLAYTSNTTDFQVSGYGSSVNAFKLVDGVETGYDYRIVTVGDNNYIVYTGTRSGTDVAPVDNTQLMLSKLVQTDNAYGFVNPIAGNSTSADKAISVDNDVAGDLDFYTWAEDNNIHVIWVSYKDKSTAPVKPTGNLYSFGIDTMNEKNYLTIGKPAGGTYNSSSGTFDASGDTLVINGTTVTAGNYDSVTITEVSPVIEPVEGSYYTIVAPDPSTGWKSEEYDGKTYYYPETYDTLADAMQGYTDDKAAYDAYQAYLDAMASYEQWSLYYKWYNYYGAADVQNQIVNASRNTVVKHATFDTTATDTSTTFTTPDTVSEISTGTGTYYFLPQAVGDVAVYAQSVPYSEVQFSEQLSKYEAYLNATMTGTGSDGTVTSQDYLDATKSYRMAYQQSMLSIYGGNSMLTVTKPDGTPYADGVMYVSKHQEGIDGYAANQTNEILTNLEVAEIGGTYYLSYVTVQDSFITDIASGYKDISSISRLYLRTFTIGGTVDAPALVWGDPYLLRTIVNNEQDSTGDGVYNSSLTKIKGYIDPYIANLSFLSGALGDKLVGTSETFEPFADGTGTTVETFLLFEMNGNTYVIDEDSLKSITNPATKTGTIYPFFTYEQRYGGALENGSEQNLSSGKSEVVIGTDGDGNIAAVYTGSVPNTVNNAIYIAYWDPVNGAWSNGVMLAMNYMDVYERSVAEGWDAKTTEAAYFDTNLNGGLTRFSFSNLQIALGRKEAGTGTGTGGAGLGGLGTLGVEGGTTVVAESAESQFAGFISEMGLPMDPEGLETLGSSYSKAELYALAEQAELRGFATGSDTAAASELLILTQGLKQELTNEYKDSNGETLIAPKLGTDDMPLPGNLGVYAISYGKGAQQVGNASIRFSYNEFTVGSQLHAIVSFMNVGDAAIRGSELQPVTVKLMLYDADGATTEMAEWKVNQMIGAGQTVNLSTTDSPCAPIVSSLGTGDYFYITVSEDQTYTEGTYSYDSSSDSNIPYRFEIDNKPELGIERFKSSVIGVEDNGDAIVDLSFDVTNRGSSVAEDVFVQFSYVSGYDTAGNAIYMPLNLTDSNLYVSQQKLITGELNPLGVNDLSKGIIYLGTDPTFYTDDYYITVDEYNEILRGYYSTTAVTGWDFGTYNGTTYWFDKRYHISAYAAYTAGQEAVKGWSSYSTDGTGIISGYYNNSYASYADAKLAADEARKAEYIITAEAYGALPIAQKELWAASDITGYYIRKGYSDHADANAAYEAALSDTTQNIISNYCRTIRGTVNVAPDHFNGKVTGSLDLRVKVFSTSSSASLDAGLGLYSSLHSDEYYSENNTVTAQIEHSSFIAASPKIMLAEGSTHRIPVSIRTTTGNIPEIRVVEVEDGVDELSTLYYSADTDTDGVASTATGEIIVVGNKKGEGVIHVVDAVTNTTYPITYRVADAGDGTNIYNDDALFTFYNADGTLYNETELNQSWKFEDQSSGWTTSLVPPYLRNLAIGENNAYFTFETKASKVSFDMIGSAEVTSNKFPGTFTVSHSGEGAPPRSNVVDFRNDSGTSHIITVKVTDSTTHFDTVIFEYSSGYTPPSDDLSAPGIFWSRSFPTGNSVQTVKTLDFTAYAVDESGLQSLTFNGTSLPDSDITKTTKGLWSHTFSVTENGSFTVSAIDTNENTTSRRVDVDWFTNNAIDAGVIPYGEKPSLTNVTAFKINNANPTDKQDLFAGANVTMTEDEKESYKIMLSAESTDGNLSYYYYDDSVSMDFVEMLSGGDPSPVVESNGYYMIKSSNNSYDTWSAQILYIDCFESVPEISITATPLTAPNGYKLEWQATKDEESTATLASVKVNGIDLSSGIESGATTYSGANTVLYGGEYKYRVEDTKGVYGTRTVSLKVPIDISNSKAVTYADPWSQPVNGIVDCGTITLDFSKITGGDYTAASASGASSLDEYYGEYEAVVLSEDQYTGQELPGTDSLLVDGADSWLTDASVEWKPFAHNESNTWSNLKAMEDGEGKYLVIIRDTQNPEEYSTMACREITLSDNSIDCVSLSSRLASSSSASDGEVYVSTAGGDTGSYEFAILPLEVDTENSTSTNIIYKPRTADDFKAPGVKWQLSDWDSSTFSDAALAGLAPGRYQVAIRSFFTDNGKEIESMTALNVLGAEPANKREAVENIEKDIMTNVNSMTYNISVRSSEWRTASESVASLKAIYEDLLARRSGGDTTVTPEDVNNAWDSWQAAVPGDETAKLAYLSSITGASDEQKNNFVSLRSNWLSSSSEYERSIARKAYETAIYDYCLAYWTNYYSAALSAAKAEQESAEKAYNDSAADLATLSAAEYTSNIKLWDGMLTGEALQVSITYGMGTSLRASPRNISPTSSTGKIYVTANGGSAYDGGEKVNYQFAILPIENKASAEDYTGKRAEIGGLGLDWQFADDLELAHKNITFTNLASGWYQVFVRPVYDPDLRDGYDVNTNIYDVTGNTSDLATLKKAYEDAEAATDAKMISAETNAAHALFLRYQLSEVQTEKDAYWADYLKAINNNKTVTDALNVWLTATDDAEKKTAYEAYRLALSDYFTATNNAALIEATFDYSSKLIELENQVEKAYSDNPGNYDTASFATVYIGIDSDGDSSSDSDGGAFGRNDVTYGDGQVTYTINEGSKLLPEERQQILNDNKTLETHLIVGGRRVVVPAGALTDPDEILNLINGFTGGTGNAVEYTDAEGNTSIVPISLLENGQPAYMYMGPGTYKIIAVRAPYFSDMINHWANASVAFTAGNGLFNGVSDSLFAPNSTMTRAMLATVLYRMMGQPEIDDTNPFDDVADDSWYTDAVMWAQANGIVRGVSANHFAPDRAITRADMVTMLYRFMNASGFSALESSGLDDYPDGGDVPPYAVKAFEWAVASGIITGKGEGRLDPMGNATRAEVATVFERIIRYILK